jgi:hypothetical protein
MTSEEIDPRAIKTIHCPRCRLPAIVTSTEREVVELEAEDLERLSKKERADYESALAMGGGDNWSEVVETAICQTCRVMLTRRTLGAVETVSVLDTTTKPAPLSKATPRATPPVERRAKVASAKKPKKPKKPKRPKKPKKPKAPVKKGRGK